MERETVATLAAPFLPWMIEILIRSLLLLALTEISLFALRRSSAAIRHLVLSLTVAGLLALPLLLSLLPSWSVPSLTLPQSLVVPSVGAPRAAGTSTDGRSGGNGSRTAPQAAPSLPRNESVPSPLPGGDSAEPTQSAFTAPAIAFSLWALGAGLLLFRIGIGLLRLHRIAASARPFITVDQLQQEQISELSQSLGLRQSVRLVIAPPDMPGVSPMTWGILRPIVLLPAEFAAWPADRLRSVLLHELAHVQRGDWATELMGRVACALYWPNPLVWRLVRRLRSDSESACDDRVLLAGVAPASYANHLLEIVRTLKAQRSLRLLPMDGVMMAQHSGLESRVRAILSGNHSRRPATVRVMGLALVLACSVLFPLARPHSAATVDQSRIIVPEKYRNAGRLRVATDAAYPPFESVKYNGLQKDHQGFDIDLGNALGKELGLKLVWTDTAWTDVLPALRSRKVDLIMSGMTITDERKRDRAFTRPYFLSRQVIARRRGDTTVASLADLRRPGRTVAVQHATTGETVALTAKVPVGQIKRYGNLPAALLDLRIGRADAVVADFPALRYLVAKDSPELEIVSGELLVRENLGIAARKDDIQLVRALNEAFGRLLDNGTYAKIYKRWMGETPSPALIADLKKVRNAGTKIPAKN